VWPRWQRLGPGSVQHRLNTLITFIEPLPIGLLIALISAAILRKRQAGFQAASGG